MLKPGDWIFTTYHVPFDIAEAGAKEFNGIIFTKFQKNTLIYFKKEKGSDIRFGLPKGEEFIKPIKRQWDIQRFLIQRQTLHLKILHLQTKK